MKKVLICIMTILNCSLSIVSAQKLPVNTLVNSVYKIYKEQFAIDTVLFLNNKEPDFFLLDSNGANSSIKVFFFRTAKEVNDFIASGNRPCVVDITIVDIGSDTLKLKIEMSKTTGEKVNGRNFYRFVDKRLVICTLDSNQRWQFLKTIEIEDE